eukprot:1113093-Pyramimonas_sp.AAC.1
MERSLPALHDAAGRAIADAPTVAIRWRQHFASLGLAATLPLQDVPHFQDYFHRKPYGGVGVGL